MKVFSSSSLVGLILMSIFGFNQIAWAQCGSSIPAPELSVPENGAEDVSLTPTLAIILRTNEQADEGACSPFRTWVQVASQPDFQQDSLILSTLLDQADLDVVTISANILNTNTTYYWRAATSYMANDVELAGQFTDAASFKTVACNLDRLTNFAPENGARILEAPTLSWEISGFGSQPRCETNLAEWQIATEPSFDIDTLVFSQNGEGTDSFRFIIPDSALMANTDYYWRVRILGIGGEVGPWTTSTDFTIISQINSQFCNWPTIFNLTPANNATGIDTTPFLELDLGSEPEEVCEHNATQWQILPVESDDGFTITSSNGLLSFSGIPENTLDTATTYRWRARLHSNASDSSEWSSFTNFTTGSLVDLEETCFWPPIEHVSPAREAVGVVLNPSLSIRFGGATGVPQNCELSDIRWQVSTQAVFATRNVVFDSGGMTGNTTSHQVPQDLLIAGTIYYWRVRPLSEDGITSTVAWSAPTRFTTGGSQGPVDAPDPDPGDPGPPAGPSDSTVTCAIDVNNNNLIDDNEMLEAIRLWVTAEVVNGTDGLNIEDAGIRGMIRQWVLGESLDCGAEPLPPVQQQLPDLVLNVEETPQCLLLGSFLNPPQLTVFVRNIGQANARGFMSGIYLSDDEIIDRQDQVLLGGRDSIGDLSPGAAERLFVDVGVLENLELGDYFLGMLLDEGEDVLESNETNNNFSVPVKLVDSADNC